MAHIRDPQNHIVVNAEKPETLVRGLALYSAAGMAFPQPQVIKWMEHQTPEFMSLPDFWLPYDELSDGTVFVAPWARGAYTYLVAINGNRAIPDITTVDPAEWYGPLVERVKDWDMDERTRDMVEFASEQMDPNHELYGDFAARAFPKIRSAIDAGKVSTKSPRELRSRGRPRGPYAFSGH